MANIVIFSYSNVAWAREDYFDSFVTGFANALTRCGNNVLNIGLQGFVTNFATEYISNSNREVVGDLVSKFHPNLILTFNNMLHDTEHIKKLSCPIVLYPSDGVDFFWRKKFIQEELDRYWFLNPNEFHCKSFINTFPALREERLIPFGYVTDFRRRSLEQDINISFLGSIPNYDTSIMHYLREMHSDELNRTFYEALETFRLHPYKNFPLELQDFQCGVGYSIETLVGWLITCKARFQILSELFPYGLNLYGYNSFLDCALYNYEFINHYSHEVCVTQEQAEILYNRSKVSLNLPNARAVTGFSWRVPDILASQSTLLSCKSPDLSALTEKHIPLPMYESAAEAKELVVRLLADDIWRNDITLACNTLVEENCRFEQHFPNIESATGVKIMNHGKGQIKTLYCTNKNIILQDTLKAKNEFLKTEIIGNKRVYRERILEELTKILPYFLAKKILKKIKHKPNCHL